MRGEAFNDGWKYRRRVGAFDLQSAPEFQPVRLPHDAMLAAGRDPDGDPAVAYFRGGAYEYEKRFDVPTSWRDRTVVLRFEGVYRDASVYLNREPVAHRPYGYSEFAFRIDDHLDFGAENVVRVECRSGNDSRWYSGAGIYRDVTLFVASPIHVALDGVRVSTPEISDEVGVAIVDVEIDNDTARRATVEIVTEIIDPDGTVVASDRQPVTVARMASATARTRLIVPKPRRWSTETPDLYVATTRLSSDGIDIDTASTTFGIRSLSVDSERGLRINGESVKLRGACIHHDNGVLGAATFASAEERRVVTLKEAGFNALRMSHHPMSRALLDACDRHGMLVVDEAFDMWRIAKRDHDYAAQFATWWRSDIEAMIAKDINRPSVIMYSIGNEIEEVGVAAGAGLSREMAGAVRHLDSTRPVTNGVNLILPFLRGGSLNEAMAAGAEVDTVYSELVSPSTEEAFAVLDIAGYNYAAERYADDGESFPNRVIVGSETFPGTIDRSWRAVLDSDHVIGDFTWTGWDYLGEVGVGRVEYGTEGSEGLMAPYPWRTAACGDMDIIGQRLPVSYYRQIVFGLRADPYIAVHPPAHYGQTKSFSTPWSWSSAVESWTWDGDEGRPTTVEVYADADEVELLQDGRPLGRMPAGEAHRFTARFDAVYQPGELTAVAWRGKTETGRTVLRSAGPGVQLAVEAESPQVNVDGHDLVFVAISVVDAHGAVNPCRDRDVAVTVAGPGVLQGLGSGAPVSEDSFLANRCKTYRGRAVAVVCPTGSGEIMIQVSGEGIGDAVTTVLAVE